MAGLGIWSVNSVGMHWCTLFRFHQHCPLFLTGWGKGEGGGQEGQSTCLPWQQDTWTIYLLCVCNPPPPPKKNLKPYCKALFIRIPQVKFAAAFQIMEIFEGWIGVRYFLLRSLQKLYTCRYPHIPLTVLMNQCLQKSSRHCLKRDRDRIGPHWFGPPTWIHP